MNRIGYNGSFLPAQYQQQGLGLSIFGINLGKPGKWLKKGLQQLTGMAASALKMAVPFAAKWIDDGQQSLSELIEDINEDFLGSKTTANNELTASEEAILNTWVVQFQNYIKGLITELGQVSKLSPDFQVAGLNGILNRINAIQQHYLKTPQAGLSQKALDQRNYVIYESLKLIDGSVKLCVDKLKSQGINLSKTTVTIPISSYSFAPLFTSTVATMVTSENYELANKVPGSTTTTPGTTKAPGVEVISTPIKPGTTLPNTTLPTMPVATNPATTGATTGKGNTTKLVVGGVIAAGLLYAAFGGNGKKKASGSRKPAAKRKSK